MKYMGKYCYRILRALACHCLYQPTVSYNAGGIYFHPAYHKSKRFIMNQSIIIL